MLEKIIDKTKQNMKKILVGATLLGMANCYVHTQSFEGVNNPRTRKEIATDNLIKLFSNRGYVAIPQRKYIDTRRIKIGCEGRRRGDFLSFNCRLLKSMEYSCDPLKGRLLLKLRTGEECPLTALNVYLGTGDGCKWAKQVEINLKEYCPDKNFY